MPKHFRMIDAARRNLTEIENSAIDELLAAVGRREFLRHGSVLGLSLPFLGGIASALGLGTGETRAEGKPGGTVRAGVATPGGAIDPVTYYDSGSYQLVFQTAEFLCITQPDVTLKPVLAESWSPNEDGSLLTFKLRKGVKFHNGEDFKADDVVATFDRLADPSGSSNALSVFKGLLSKGGTQKVDDHTVAFHLDAPNGSFPYSVSIDNYNAVILPASYKGDYKKTFEGTGHFVSDLHAEGRRHLVRNPDYWGEKALPDRLEFKFYGDVQPRILALQAGEVDLLDAVPLDVSQVVLNSPDITVLRVASTAHRQLHMRCDMAPFTDKRVRQALALCIDRSKLVDGLCRGMAATGNDSPFAPAFPATDKSIPQRAQDIAKAKQLMEAAGFGSGFDITLTTLRYSDVRLRAIVPELRQGDRRAPLAQHRGPGQILRQGGVRPVGLAGQPARYHRLRAPKRAERVPEEPTGQRWAVERGAFQTRPMTGWSPAISRRSTSMRSARRPPTSRSC